MTLRRIWVCTSKNSKLHRIYLLNTGTSERSDIYECFREDLQRKELTQEGMNELNGNALIDDIPYYVDFDQIIEDSYLYSFKEKLVELSNPERPEVIHFSRNPLNTGVVTNLDENEGIKFIIADTGETYYFLQTPSNSIIKNRIVMKLSITENSTVVDVPKGIQIPQFITAKYDLTQRKIYVYDVNKFESMLTLHENQKAKAQSVLNKFVRGDYKISSDEYTFSGLDTDEVKQKLHMSNRSLRRLAKYQSTEDNYSIEQIKEAVNKLVPELRVTFNDEDKVINVTEDTAKTFVGIIHNSIVQRLISGDVEIAI